MASFQTLILSESYLGIKRPKAAPNRRKRRLVHPWNRLKPDASDRGIHASLHFWALDPEIALLELY
jgi:hypothetical protein